MNPSTPSLKAGSMARGLAQRAPQFTPQYRQRNRRYSPSANSSDGGCDSYSPTDSRIEHHVCHSRGPADARSTGVTVALVLGLIVLVALVAFAAFLVLRRRRKARPHLVDPYATETMPMATLRSRTSIIKRPGGVGVLSSVNDRSVIAGRGWVRLDTEDRASFDYTYAESTNPPSYDHETSEWAGPSVQHPIGVGRAGGARGASTPTPGADATAFRAHGTNRNSAGFRMVRGPRADTPQDWREDGQGRQAGQEPRALGLDPVDTNRTAAPGPSESPSTPTAHSPPTPRASHLSHLSHVTSFRGELHRYDTFGRRREDTPSALFDVSDATVHTAIAGQRAGPAWAPAPQ